MKRLKKDLLAISKTMAELTQAIDTITKKLETLEQSETKKKRPAAEKKKPSRKASPKTPTKSKSPKAPEPPTAIDTVTGIVNRSKNGVSIDALRKKTGFESRKIHSILYKLRKRGKIKNKKKGVYIKA